MLDFILQVDAFLSSCLLYRVVNFICRLSNYSDKINPLAEPQPSAPANELILFGVGNFCLGRALEYVLLTGDRNFVWDQLHTVAWWCLYFCCEWQESFLGFAWGLLGENPKVAFARDLGGIAWGSPFWTSCCLGATFGGIFASDFSSWSGFVWGS